MCIFIKVRDFLLRSFANKHDVPSIKITLEDKETGGILPQAQYQMVTLKN